MSCSDKPARSYPSGPGSSRMITISPTIGEKCSCVLYKTEPTGNLNQAKLSDMVKDWFLRKEPTYCEICNTFPSEESVALGFYRDQYDALSRYESDIVKLLSFSGKDKQEALEYMSKGEELDCCEDFDADDKVNVLNSSDEEIGSLPKKYASEFLENGFKAIFLNHVEENDSGKLVPFVRIFKNK